jgi:Activator of Hsp90 ATPase homolog 1-like protein
MNSQKLAAVVKIVEVNRSADDAFAIFTRDISSWWPLATHTRAKSADGQMAASVTIEPWVGGRVFETLTDGRQLDWGSVTTFVPGVALELDWRLGRPAEEGTRVCVRFDPLTATSCQVYLTHDGWEKLGEDAASMRHAYDQGWVTVFEAGFADAASAS